MKKADLPEFPEEGALLWDELGYHFPAPTELDLRDNRALYAANHWSAFTAILEHAKVGQFGSVSQLAERMKNAPNAFFAKACLSLLGDAGTEAQIALLAKFMLSVSDDYLRVKACEAALHTGYIFLAPIILEAWCGLKRSSDRDMVSCYLSDLLEEEAGPISEDLTDSQQEYVDIVSARISELVEKLGDDRVAIFRGKKTNPVHTAQLMLEILKERPLPSGIEGEFITLRHRFEASTGTDCRGFFKDSRLRPLDARVTLETFLASASALHFKDGVRYFFGHRIP